MTATITGRASTLTVYDRSAKQLSFWPTSVSNPWARQHRALDAVELARMLPPNLSVEFTAEHGWRIVPLPAEARRALELLDIHEGDVLPDAVMLERRRRRTAAQLLLEQAQAVLRSVQADNEAAAARCEEAVA